MDIKLSEIERVIICAEIMGLPKHIVKRFVETDKNKHIKPEEHLIASAEFIDALMKRLNEIKKGDNKDKNKLLNEMQTVKQAMIKSISKH